MIKTYQVTSNGRLANTCVTCATHELWQDDDTNLYNALSTPMFKIYDLLNYYNKSLTDPDWTEEISDSSGSTFIRIAIYVYEFVDGDLEIVYTARLGSNFRTKKIRVGEGQSAVYKSNRPLLYQRFTVTHPKDGNSHAYGLMKIANIWFSFEMHDGDGIANSTQLILQASEALIENSNLTEYYFIPADVIHELDTSISEAGTADAALTRANLAIEKANEADNKASRLEKIDVNGLISI